jgi:CheY-like chemotaxis protein
MKVLLVEDEMMLAMLAEDTLTELGCAVVSASRIGSALALVRSDTFDVALLDVNVAGEEVYPVADALIERGIPFVFATGYGQAGLRHDYRTRRALEKPYRHEDIGHALVEAMAGSVGA